MPPDTANTHSRQEVRERGYKKERNRECVGVTRMARHVNFKYSGHLKKSIVILLSVYFTAALHCRRVFFGFQKEKYFQHWKAFWFQRHCHSPWRGRLLAGLADSSSLEQYRLIWQAHKRRCKFKQENQSRTMLKIWSHTGKWVLPI